jgi:hypothetical protein
MMSVKVRRGTEEEERGTTSTTLVKVIGRGVQGEEKVSSMMKVKVATDCV